MDSEEKIDDELNRISAGFPKPNAGNDIPPGYFDELPDRILIRMAKETKTPNTRRLSWITSLAAAVVLTGLMVAASFLFLKKDSAIEPITSLEAYQYIEANMDEFEYLLEDEFTTPPGVDFDIAPEVIEEYLHEELEGVDPENYFE